jgi:hypothetical protein
MHIQHHAIYTQLLPVFNHHASIILVSALTNGEHHGDRSAA